MAEEVPAHIAHPCKDYPTSYNYFSTFREEPGLCAGDTYSGGQAAFEKSTLSRHAGKRLVNRPPLEGKTPDVYFDKAVGSLRDGDVYLDPLYLEKALKAMVGGKNSSPHPFYPPKNPKKSACPGDPASCMGTVGLLGADWSNSPVGPAPKKPGKNLYTNPGRRGGMGFSHKDRTIGQNPPTYMPDMYQHGRQLGKELRRKARERIVKPFNSSPNKGNGMFNTNPFKSLPGPDTVEVKEKKLAIKKPFIPSNPPKKGAAYEAISKTGREYVPDPVPEAKFQAGGEGKKTAFKPCAGIKERLSMYTVNPYQYDARPPPDLDFTLLP